MDALHEFAIDLGQLWPLYVAAAAVLAVVRAGARHVSGLIKPVADRLDGIEAEFRPNGGGSIRDLLNRLESRQSLADGTVGVLWDAAPEALFESDAYGKMTDCNTAYLDLWKMSRSEALASEWITKLTPKSHDLMLRRVSDGLEKPKKVSYEMDLIDGRVLRVLARPRFVGDEFVGYSGAVLEVGFWG